MSRQSAKSAGRSTKTAGGATGKTAKKAAKGARAVKSARGSAKKTSKSARRPAVKSVRSMTTTIARAPSVAPEAAAAMIRTASPPMQPVVAAQEPPARAHKYRVGETVYYTSPTFGRAAATGSYTVMKLLPSEGDEHQYRIKNSDEAFERVAKESQLDRA
jgi:hypothetical protein